MMARLAHLLKQFRFRQFRVSFTRCQLCRWPIQIKLRHDEMAVRCTHCGASAVSQSMGQVFREYNPNHLPVSVYELSSTGPFVNFLKRSKHDVTLSEWMDEVPLGSQKNGVTCQDVQHLTYQDHSFDVCTSCEVFEHVEDDIKGFSEIYRVLKPGGQFIFTVPISLDRDTIERTRVINGQREQVLPAEYHTDKLKGVGQVFCYRNYGVDIVKRLQRVGFINSKILIPHNDILFGLGRPVIYAKK